MLVIGAGGLGCELLKDLALSGFTDIHVIDMDTIDVSNLNRQFLFRPTDVGRPKAVTAAEFVNKRLPHVTITPHFGKIQDKEESFYEDFDIIISGLDNVDARRWINALVINMHKEETKTIPLIDGGTEGWKGQARVIIPGQTACFECSLALFPPPTTYPLCTLATNPRLPEHCIEFASLLEWPKEMPFGSIPLNGDNPEHLAWITKVASDRAAEFNISGVTLKLVKGVIKNIIPVVASTNAIVAAACALEALKIATLCAGGSATNGSPTNYMMYSGSEGCHTNTFNFARTEDCAICADEPLPKKIWLPANIHLQDVLERLQSEPDLQLRAPSIRTDAGIIYMKNHPSATANILKPFRDLLGSDNAFTVTDPSMCASSMNVVVQWE